MEKNLFKEKDEENDFHFPLQYKNQNDFTNPAFQEWYKIKKEYIKNENKKEGKTNLIFSYCPNCISYAICIIDINKSFVKCMNCKKEFCVGCHRNKIYDEERTICLKAYFKLLYYRVINIISSYGRYKSYEFHDFFILLLFFFLYLLI